MTTTKTRTDPRTRTRTTLILPEGVHRRVKFLALRLNTTAQALVARALEEFLQREEKRGPK